MLFAGATICVLVAAICQARILRLTGLDALTGTVVLAVTQVVLISFLLLAASAYYAGPLTIVAAGDALTSGLLVATAGRGSPVRWRVVRRPRRPRTAAEWVTALLLALVVAHLLMRLVLAIRLVPYGYDALAYHLAAVGWMVQDGRLPGPATGILVSGYPLNGELLAAWPAALLRDDVLSRVPQVLTAVLGGLATTGMARGVGVGRAPAVAAGCVFVLTPALLAQTTTAYVDVTAAALALVAVCSIIRWVAWPGAGFGQLVIGGLAAGLAAGTKQTGILLAAACLVAILLLARRRSTPRALAVTAYAVPAFVTGGGWYVKNLVVYGNPVYPVAIAGLPGRTDVSGLLTAPPGPSLPEPVPTLWSWAHDLLPQTAYTYEQRAGGLGTVFLWAGLPCLFLVILRTLRRRDLPWAVLLAVTLGTFAVQPYRWWARFTFPLAALAAVAIADVLSSSATDGLASVRTARPRRLVLLGMAAAAVLLAQPTLFARAVVPTDGSRPTAAWEAFSAPAGDRLSGGPGRPNELAGVASAQVVSVAVDEVGRTGSLFGPRFQREVRPVATADRTAFARSLRGADVLVACRGSRIARWAAEDPQHLRPVSDPHAGLGIWRIRGRPSAHGDGASPAPADDVYCD